MKILWILCAAGALYFLQQEIFKRMWSKGLGTRVQFTEEYVYEGQKAHLTEEIVNDKWMPMPAVEVRFALDKALQYEGEDRENTSVSDKNYRRDIFSLFSHQKNIRTLTLDCEKRGYYQIPKAELVGYDFFFRKKYYEAREQQTGLFVYPHLVDTAKIQLICREISGMRPVRNPLYQDPFAFAGIRAYDRGDPMNRINWKASARGGDLMVNQYDATTSMWVKIFLNVSDDHIMKYPQLVEEGISIAAALATRLREERMDAEVEGNAPSAFRQQNLRVSLKNDSSSLWDLYRELACIRTDETVCGMKDLLARQAEHVDEQCVYVVISHNRDPYLTKGLGSLADAGARVLWIMPVEKKERFAELQDGKNEIPGVRRMVWEAEV